jgi:hypothetical protein
MFQTIGVDSHDVSRTAAFPYFAAFIEYFSKSLLLWIGLVEDSNKAATLWEHGVQVVKASYGGSKLIVPLVLLQVAYQLGEGFSVLYLPASLFALIRNLRIPCVATLSRLCFGKEKGHTWQQWTLLLGITSGASLAAFIGHDRMTSRTTYISGVSIALIVVLLSSMKSVMEQGLLHAQVLSPLVVAGLQGLLSCAVVAVVLAAVHVLGVEDLWDTVSMLRSSTILTINVIVFGLTCMVDAWLGAMVTLRYDSTVKVTVSSTTVFGIWAVQLGIHSFEPSRGEPFLFNRSLGYLFCMIMTVALVIAFVRTKQPRTQLIGSSQPTKENRSLHGLLQP